RKHVTPADPAATIPDPSRGRPLPPEGLAVTWGPYWAGLAARGEITVSELPADDPEAGPAPEAGSVTEAGSEVAAPAEAAPSQRKGAKPAA
uniref:hypothetical protein n=1 Tax=Methylobacterium sp. CCH5-D2 TaxID=1768765 RepID=UPI000A98F7D8